MSVGDKVADFVKLDEATRPFVLFDPVSVIWIKGSLRAGNPEECALRGDQVIATLTEDEAQALIEA